MSSVSTQDRQLIASAWDNIIVKGGRCLPHRLKKKNALVVLINITKAAT